MNKSHKKGLDAVNLCRNFLTELGFVVSIPAYGTEKGHDLYAIRNGKGITVEVKAVFCTHKVWMTSAIGKSKSDFIALVFPSGHIQFDDMEAFLKNTDKVGRKCVTKVGWLLNKH